MALISNAMQQPATERPAPGGQPLMPQDIGASQDPAQNPQDDGLIQQGMGEEGGEQASPEEQAQYEALVYNAMEIVYGEGTSDQVMGLMQSAESVPEGVANAANMILSKGYESAHQNGMEINNDVLQEAGEDIIAMLFDLAKEGGITQGEPSDDDVFLAMTMTLDLWHRSHPDSMDEEGMREGMQQIGGNELMSLMSQFTGGDQGGAVPGGEMIEEMPA